MIRKTLMILGMAVCVGVSCRQHDWRELTLYVPEMHNQASVQLVMQALSRGPAIQPDSVRVNLAARTIHFTYNSLMAADKNYEHLVAQAGFTCNEVPAYEKARDALPADVRE